MACKDSVWIGVDPHIDWLSRAHQFELRLLEIRRNPDLRRDQHHQHLSGLGIVASSGRKLCHPADNWGADLRAREVGLGLALHRERLVTTSHRLHALSLQNRKLHLGCLGIRLGGGECRLGLPQIGGRLLCALLCAGACLEQFLSTRVLVPGELESRLRLPYLLLRLLDAGILCIDLSIEVRNGRLGLCDLCLCLGKGRLIVARIDPHQNSVYIHDLVVGH